MRRKRKDNFLVEAMLVFVAIIGALGALPFVALGEVFKTRRPRYRGRR